MISVKVHESGAVWMRAYLNHILPAVAAHLFFMVVTRGVTLGMRQAWIDGVPGCEVCRHTYSCFFPKLASFDPNVAA